MGLGSETKMWLSMLAVDPFSIGLKGNVIVPCISIVKQLCLVNAFPVSRVHLVINTPYLDGDISLNHVA